MTANGRLQRGIYLGVLLACVKPLGRYMAKVITGRAPVPERVLGPVERWHNRISGVDYNRKMTWRQDAASAIALKRPIENIETTVENSQHRGM